MIVFYRTIQCLHYALFADRDRQNRIRRISTDMRGDQTRESRVSVQTALPGVNPLSRNRDEVVTAVPAEHPLL